MKKYLWSILLAILTLTFTAACGDDDENNEGDNPNVPGTVDWKTGITESGNTITFSYETKEGDFTIKYKEVYTFENNRCVKLDYTITYPSKQYADIAMAAIRENPEDETYFKDLRQDGSSITYTLTDTSLIGTREEVMSMLKNRQSQMGG